MGKFAQGKALPCAWAFLPGKSEDIYEVLVRVLLEKINKDGGQHKPQSVVSDFESAVINVIKLKLPDVRIVGCGFHFRHAIWGKVKEIGLVPLVNRDAQFHTWINMLYALAYVPVNRVVQYYEEVVLSKFHEMTNDQDEDDNEGSDAELSSNEGDREEDDESAANRWKFWLEEIEGLILYFERTWIGLLPVISTRAAQRKLVKVGRRKPMFAHALWNQYSLMVDHDEESPAMTTNNCVESYNRVMNSLLGPKPNLWKVMSSLVSQEAEARRTLYSNAARHDAGSNSGRKSLVTGTHMELKSAMKNMDNLNPAAYLNNVANIINKTL